MTSREHILGRIRAGLGERADTRDAEYGAIPRGYIQAGRLGEAERLNLFVERLEDYEATVHRCAGHELRQTIADVLASRRKRRVVVPADLPADWIPEGLDLVVDARLDCAALDRVEAVLTGCTGAIAVTGTIVLRHAAGEGRRALTLVPDYHLCVVRTDQVVETVPEALRAAAMFHPSLLTTISGPSATADIEMTRIKGVHGPRTLEVILVTAG